MYIVKEKFKDFNGQEREEEFLFNLTTTEVAKLELTKYGGLSSMLQTIVAKKDIATMIEIFELIVDSSYGVKSPDGRNFIKNEQVLNDFKSTNAYSQIFMRFATDQEFTAEFIKNVIPSDLEDQVNEMLKKGENVVAMPTNK